ncbi:MAG: hypothetical protein HQK79_03770 [Desulfobacterales bacterium]|nr:hypothetical protein [Desulfobacterales bacterium]MBF0396756.1 hypothetical protein [Desulfobacterales bacterium]
MKDDPVIERIREVRRKISESYGHDTERLIRHYQEIQKETKRKFFKREVKENKIA